MNPDILTAPSSTLMSRLSKVDWFKGAVKMSEFFVGADFRVTNYSQIERWWEMVMSAYLLVSLHTNALYQPQSQPTIHSNAQQSAHCA